MIDENWLEEPLFVVVVVLHTPLTQVVVVQVSPEHDVLCLVLCVRALAVDVNVTTIVRLNMTVSGIAGRNILVFSSFSHNIL
ncbi:MAG: hypothetical protein ACJ71G_00345 [Nitrososphaeraceae archaeon]